MLVWIFYDTVSALYRSIEIILICECEFRLPSWGHTKNDVIQLSPENHDVILLQEAF